MLIGALFDLHWRTRWMDHHASVLDQALGQMVQQGVELVLCGGDVWDDARIFDRHGAKLPQTMIATFQEIVAKHMIPWVAIPGNHDRPAGTEHHALAVFAQNPWIEVLDWDTATTAYELGDVAVIGLPWPTADEAATVFSPPALRSRLIPGKFNILLGHVEVAGAMLNRYIAIDDTSTLAYADADLRSVGADAVLLGHLHARQMLWQDENSFGLYGGALSQLNFGEEGNPQGWVMLDTDTKKVEFIGISSPRYYTVTTEDYEQGGAWGKLDHVRVTGDRCPAGLADNAHFVPTKTQAAVRSRAEGINPRATPADLLALWLGATQQESPPNLLDHLQEIESRINISGDTGVYLGSLGRIDRIVVRGFGPHANLEVSCQDRTAICGPNGSGKTVVLEGMVAGLYGRWPSGKDRGSLGDLMAGDKAELRVEFQADGSFWAVHRTLERRPRSIGHKARLWRDGVLVVDRKSTQVRDEIRKVVGPEDLVTGTIFLGQFAENDLVGADPRDRKTFIGRFLGLERFGALHNETKQAAQTARSRQESLSRGLPTPEDLQDRLEGIQEQLMTAEFDIASQEQVVLELEQQIDRLTAQIQEAEQTQRDIDAARLQIRNLEVAQSRLENQISTTLKRKTDYQQALEQRDTLTLRRAALTDQIEKGKRLLQRHDLLEREILEKGVTLSQKTLVATAALEQKQHQLAFEQKRLESVASVGCADLGFLPCPFLEGLDPEITATLAEELQELQRTAQDPDPDLRRQVEETLPTDMEACRPLPNLDKHVAHLQNTERELGSLEGYARLLDDIDTQIATDQTRLRELTQEWTQLHDAYLHTSTPSTDVTELRTAYREQADLLRRARNQILELAERRGSLQAQTDRLDLDIAKAKKRQTEIARLEEEATAYEMLARGFGIDGIPQLLISDALPSLQGFINEIVTEDFDDKFSIVVDTQAYTKAGNPKEALAIMFRSASGTYDVRSCSGGEKAAVSLILRGALMLYQKSSVGTDYAVTILDEPFAHQDHQNREATMALVERLAGGSQVILSSHDPNTLMGFPHTVYCG